MRRIGLRVTGNRIIYVVKPSKDKGSAFLHSLGLLRRPASNDVVFRNASVTSGGIGVGVRERGVNVIFRRFGLFPRVAVLGGVALTPVGLLGVPGTRTRRVTLTLLGEINLRSETGTCPDRLSNKRGRQVTVIHTLYVGPRIVLFSRPASTLSPRVINRILRIVGRLTGRNVAVTIMARRVNFTHRITSHIVFVTRKDVIRRKAPRGVFAGPGGRHAVSFLGGILWWGGRARLVTVSGAMGWLCFRRTIGARYRGSARVA